MQYVIDDNIKNNIEESLYFINELTIKGIGNLVNATQAVTRLQYVLQEINKQTEGIEKTSNIEEKTNDSKHK